MTAAAVIAGGISAVPNLVGTAHATKAPSPVKPLKSQPPKKNIPRLPRGRGVADSASLTAREHIKPTDTLSDLMAQAVSEDVSRRDATTRVFRNEDHTLTVDGYVTPINYRTAKGWAPIDNTISSIKGRTGWVGTNANSWTAAFGPSGRGLELQTPDGRLTVTPSSADSISASSVKPTVHGPGKPKSLSKAKDVLARSAVPDPVSVDYKGVWPQVDVRDTVRSDRIEEDLVLAGPNAASQYVFDVGGARLTVDSSGRVRLDGGMGGRFEILAPRVRTADGADVTAASRAHYEVRSGTGRDGTDQLVVVVDHTWLVAESKTAFPVTIDPTFSGVQPPPCTAFPGANACEETISSNNAATPGSPISLGIDAGNTVYRGALYFNQYESFIGQNPPYRVYKSWLTINYGVNYPPPQVQLSLWDQGSQPLSFAGIGANARPNDGLPALVGSVLDPPTTCCGGAANVNTYQQIDRWVNQGLRGQWFGLTGPEAPGTNVVRQYDPRLVMRVYQVPPPSRVTSLADNQVLATATPTLQALAIPPSADPTANPPTYDYQITTGSTPGTGLVVSSGRQSSDVTQPPPSWQVPVGTLQEGVTYYAWVFTDWSDNQGFYNLTGPPETVPPAAWGVPFTVKLGLGDGGPSPTDQVGSVPGQTSTPSQGGPNPSLAASKVTVNMVNGNASVSVGTPTMQTVGGGVGLKFTYNSLAAASQSLQGLKADYFNDPNNTGSVTGSGVVLAGERVDPTVSFDSFLPPTGVVAAQDPTMALGEWNGSVTFPAGGNTQNCTPACPWQLGDISSDGLRIKVDGTVVLDDWASHAPESAPFFGNAVTINAVPGSSHPVVIDWHHSSQNPALAQVYVQDMSVAAGSAAQFLLPSNWLTHSPKVLPAGWALNAAAGSTARWVGLADHGSSVTVFADDGSGHEFKAAGNKAYTAPPDAANDLLSLAGSGQFLLQGGGYLYTFRPDGALSSLVAAADDQHPAALQYSYTGSPPLLRTITDPVRCGIPASCPPTGQNGTNYGQVNLYYGGDPTPPSGTNNGCPSGSSAPSGLLCSIAFWDGTATTLTYDSTASTGNLIRVTNPGTTSGAGIFDFAYTNVTVNGISQSLLSDIRDPLAYNAIAAGQRSDCTSGGLTPTCNTELGYDGTGRVVTVTQPAPAVGATRPERGYCYNAVGASFSGTTLNCGTPANNTTSVAVAGMSPSVGYAQQVQYDARNRIVASFDSAGLKTSYTWDNLDRPVAKIDPAGIATSTAYDNLGHPVTSYGPAPSSSFQPNGLPNIGANVPTGTKTYDGLNQLGCPTGGCLAGAWYPNTTLSGNPTFHSTDNLADNWAGSCTSPSSCNGGGTQVPTSGFSGALSGQLNLPQPGRISLDGDGGRVWVDRKLYVDQLGGPYSGAVRADQPTNWWRLGEASGATVAADNIGQDPGTYSPAPSVTLGQPGPLAPGDNDSTAATFNGTTGTVTIPDANTTEFDRTSTFTVETWAKSTNTGLEELVSKMANAAPYTGWEVLEYQGLVYVYLISNYGAGNYILVHAPKTVSDGAWHHIAVTYSGTSTAAGFTIYIDGSAQTLGVDHDALTGTTLSSQALSLGSRAGASYFLTGSLSDVAIYRTALTAARVTAHYNATLLKSAVTSGPVIYNTAYPLAVDGDNPVSYWRLNETTGTSAADSNGPNSGTYTGGYTLGQAGALPGDPATSVSLNGTNGYVSLPNGFSWLANGFTVDAWANPTTAASWARFMEFSTPDSNNNCTNDVTLTRLGTSNDIALAICKPSSGWQFVLTSGGVLTNSAWQHVAATLTPSSGGNGIATIFVNGIAKASGTIQMPANIVYTQNMIGKSNYVNDAYYAGRISDVAIYTSPLSGYQLAAHHNAGLAPYPTAVGNDNPVSYWRLGEAAGTTAMDNLTANPGTYTGTITLGQPGALAGDPATSASFDGSSGFVSLPNGYSWLSGGLTVDAWSKPTSTAIWARFIEFSTPDSNGSCTNDVAFARVGTTNDIGLFVCNNSTGWQGVQTSGGVLTNGSWQHVAATLSPTSGGNGTATIYLNGIPKATGTLEMPANITYNQNMIGKSNTVNDANYAGNMSDVAVYPRALTGDQIMGHYRAGLTAPSPTNTTHRIDVEDQQFVTGGHLNLTSNVTGATFGPNYGLVTQTTDPDNKITQTSYNDTTDGIGPQFGLPTATIQDPSGFALKTSTIYETPGPNTFLRKISHTLPAGNQTSYTNYAGTDGPIAAVCGLTSSTPQGGLVKQRTDPTPATGSAHVEQYVYDAVGRQVGQRVGSATTIANDTGNLLWRCTQYDSPGRATSQSWPAFGSQPARIVNYTYAVGGNPLVNKVSDNTSPGNATVSATVDLLGRTTSYTDVWGNSTTTSYDQAGRQTGTSGPMGPIAQNYDSATGRATTLQDYGTTISTPGYDPATGRLSTINYLNGTTVRDSYDSFGRPSGVTVYDKQGVTGETDTRSLASRIIGSSTNLATNYTPVTATRIADTRAGSGQPYAGQTLGPAGTLNIQVTGANGDGVPTNASSVVLHVTVVNPTSGGYLVVYPTGMPTPGTANISINNAGQTIDNQVTAQLGTAGQVTVYNNAGNTDIVVDVDGFYTPIPGGAGYNPVTQARIADTRAGSGQPYMGQTLAPGGTLTVQVTGASGDNVPAGATAAVIDLEAANEQTGGFLVAYPAGATVPNTTNVNYVTNITNTKEVVVPLSSGGAISITNSQGGTTDIVVDVEGYYLAGGGNQYNPVGPARIADTRAGSGQPYAGQTIGAGGTLTIQVTNANNDHVPATATAVVLNVVEANATAGSYFTVYPGPTRPGTANVTFPPNQVAADEVTAQIGSGGTVTIFNAAGTADVVVDVLGYFAPATATATSTYTYDGTGRVTQAALPGVTYNYGYSTTTGCPANGAGANTNRTTLAITGTGAGTTNYCYDNADRLTSTTTMTAGTIIYDDHGNTTQLGNQTVDFDAADRQTRTESPGTVTAYQRDPLDRIAQRTATTTITNAGTTSNTASGSSVTVNRPAGTQPGDLIVGGLTIAVAGTLTASGWNIAATQANGTQRTWILWRYATSTDPGSWTFSSSGAPLTLTAALSSYRNTTGSSPIAVTATRTTTLATTHPLAQVTTTGDAQQVVYVVGFNGNATATSPATQRAMVTANASLLFADAYQSRPGQSSAISATTNNTVSSESITIALIPLNTVSRLGYTGHSDNSGFVQNTAGSVTGLTIPLPGGASYGTGLNGTIYSYTDLHGDTIATADQNGNRTWTGYWGPYGENASGTIPANTILPGANYGYNGQQQKLTDGNIVQMGARPYQPGLGRFLGVDPVEGGCANNYTYSFGDPINHPDLNGEFLGVGDAFCYLSMPHTELALGTWTGAEGFAESAPGGPWIKAAAAAFDEWSKTFVAALANCARTMRPTQYCQVDVKTFLGAPLYAVSHLVVSSYGHKNGGLCQLLFGPGK
jgi:RHS repeat-associated protein